MFFGTKSEQKESKERKINLKKTLQRLFRTNNGRRPSQIWSRYITAQKKWDFNAYFQGGFFYNSNNGLLPTIGWKKKRFFFYVQMGYSAGGPAARMEFKEWKIKPGSCSYSVQFFPQASRACRQGKGRIYSDQLIYKKIEMSPFLWIKANRKILRIDQFITF